MKVDGRETCNYLKLIRKAVARANGIAYEPGKCMHVGDCRGTCPACEAEARYIERQLSVWRAAGRAVVVAGLALGAALPAQGQAVSEVRTDTVCRAEGAAAESSHVFGIVETQPSFPGGKPALVKYLRENLRFIEDKEEISGRVIVQFTVEKDGSITNVKVVRGLDPVLDAEALRVVRSMPRWRPGKIYGKSVAVKYTLPVKFGLR